MQSVLEAIASILKRLSETEEGQEREIQVLGEKFRDSFCTLLKCNPELLSEGFLLFSHVLKQYPLVFSEPVHFLQCNNVLFKVCSAADYPPQGAIETICNLLHLLGKRNITALKRTFDEYLTFAQDLMHMSLQILLDNEDNNNNDNSEELLLCLLPESCRQFDLEPMTVDVSTAGKRSKLQYYSTVLLRSLAAKFPQFLAESNLKFLELICLQLRFGDPRLKTESLSSINLMLSQTTIPPFIGESLAATISELLTFGFEKQEWCFFRDESFDTNLATCLNKFFTGYNNLGGDSFLPKIFDPLVSSLSWNIANTASPTLKVELVSCFLHIIQRRPQHTPQMLSLLAFIGSDSNDALQEAIAQCFRHFLEHYGFSNARKRSFSPNGDDIDEDQAMDEEQVIPPPTTKRRKRDHYKIDDDDSLFDQEIVEHNTLHSALADFFGPGSFAVEQAPAVFNTLMDMIQRALSPDDLVQSFNLLNFLTRVFLPFPDSLVYRRLTKAFCQWIRGIQEGKFPPKPTIENAINLMEEIIMHSSRQDKELQVALFDFIGFVHEHCGFEELLTAPKSVPHQPVPDFADWATCYSRCISLLCYFPPTFEVERRKALIGSALSDSRAEVRLRALACLPIFVRRTTNYFGEFKAGFLLDLKQRAKIETTPSVLEQISRTIAEIIQPIDDENNNDAPHSRAGRLTLCDFQEFFEALLSADRPSQVRTAFINILPTILDHVFDNEAAAYGSEEDAKLLNRCVSLMMDKDRSVRVAFARVVDHFVKADAVPVRVLYKGSATPTYKFLQALKSALKRNSNNDLTETLLMTLGHVGTVLYGSNLQFVLFMLISYLTDGTVNLRTTAYDHIRIIANHKGTTVPELVSQYQRELCPIICQLLERTLPSGIDGVTQALFDRGGKEFLQDTLHLSVPQLVFQGSIDVLNKVADYIDKSRSDIIVDYLPQIWAFLLLNNLSNDAIREHVLHALKGDAEFDSLFDVDDLFKSSLNSLCNELIWELGSSPSTDIDNERKVISALDSAYLLAGADNQRPRSETGVLIRSYLVGIIEYLHSRFTDDYPKTNTNVLETRKHVVRSLESLIRIAGRETKPYASRIVSELKLALEDKHLQSYACDAFYTLVTTLQEDCRQVLSQIVVTLLPFIESETEKVVRILEYIIVDNRNMFRDVFTEISFIPYMEPLKRVNQAMSEIMGTSTLRSKLLYVMKGMSHESVNVRIMALRQLRSILSDNKEHISAMIVNDCINTEINTLISALLHGCSHPNEELELLCCQCLGEIGAIDPARLNIEIGPLNPNPKDPEKPEIMKEMSALREEIKDDVEFVCRLILNYLYKLLKAGESSRINTVAAAVQMLLHFLQKVSSGRSKTADVRKLSWWNSFPTEVQETIKPYLTSKYQLDQKTTRVRSVPVYKSGMPLKKWLAEWSVSMFHKLKATKKGRIPIFEACRGVMKEDVPTCMFVLPYLVKDLVIHGSDQDISDIQTELVAVLNNTSAQHESNEYSFGSTDLQGTQHAQAVFSLIDRLNMWSFRPDEREYERVRMLVSNIQKDLLAKCAYANKAYARAFMYYELYLRDYAKQHDDRDRSIMPTQSTRLATRFPAPLVAFLQKIYGNLDEPDGLKGIATLRTVTSVDEQILDNETSGNWDEALTCYDHKLQLEPGNPYYHCHHLICLRNLGQLQTMLQNVDGVLARLPQYADEFRTYGVQASWRLGNWDLAEEHLRNGAKQYDFEVSVARALMKYRSKNKLEFTKELTDARSNIMKMLTAASMESYERSYPYIVKLQMLAELENSYLLWETASDPLSSARFLAVWEQQLQTTQYSLNTREPLLSLRRAIFKFHNMNDELAKSWLHWAKIARENSHYQMASSAILQAERNPPPKFYIEQAKLLKQQGLAHRAIAIVESAVETHQDSLIRAKMLLMATNWNQEARRKKADEIIEDYRTVIQLQPCWEKGYFCLAKYLDTILDAQVKSTTEMLEHEASSSPHPSVSTRSRSTAASATAHTTPDLLAPYINYLHGVMENYAKALKHGHKHLYHSLPRLLTLWFNTGTMLEERYNLESCREPAPAAKGRRGRGSGGNSVNTAAATEADMAAYNLLVKINTVIENYLHSLPTYQWYSSLSQLISRVCHKNRQVVELLKSIVVKVLKEYHRQAIWQIYAVASSSDPKRSKEAKDIIERAKYEDAVTTNILNQTTQLCDSMVSLCNYETKERKLSLSKIPVMNKLNHISRHDSEAIVPIQAMFTLQLPQHSKATTDFDALPKDPLRFAGFDDEITVLNSLQKPRKIGIRGNDNQIYHFLCKPKEDMRKDSRMMEFNTMLNRLLKKDPETRKRKLYIRTFAVLPLSDNSGIIEWVNNTEVLRGILDKLHASHNYKYKDFRDIQALYNKHSPRNTRAATIPYGAFLNELLPAFPPIFYKWFLLNFPEPTKWFESKLNYSRTLAVWSMVGHVVGLGDRHGENIMFDSTNGDCVHVDFSCLFDKGTTLQIPECVPFRLTNNLVDAFGVSGYEGVFRSVCETTMVLLRENKDTLMNVLETFIHDPLVEWNSKKASSSGVAYTENQEPVKQMQKVERKLQGIVDDVSGQPLAVQAQVQQLIDQATSPELLCKMYIGWMPWL